MNIHPSSIVSEKAKIDPSVKIGPFCIIGDNVEIKSGSSILSHAVIKGPTVIGKDVAVTVTLFGADGYPSNGDPV